MSARNVRTVCAPNRRAVRAREQLCAVVSSAGIVIYSGAKSAYYREQHYARVRARWDALGVHQQLRMLASMHAERHMHRAYRLRASECATPG